MTKTKHHYISIEKKCLYLVSSFRRCDTIL